MPWNKPPQKTVAPIAKRLAPKLRRAATPAERALWKGLRGAIDLPGTHFRRQVPLGPYVVDFCCLRHRVIVEVDGAVHDTAAAQLRDRCRDEYLRGEGFSVVRVTNDEVLTRLPIVIDRLTSMLVAATPTPGPSPQGGGGQWSIS
jgi:very-short-patch-repair endonuclease